MFSPNVFSNEIIKKQDKNGFSLKKIFYAAPLISIEYEHIDESVIPNSGIIEIPLEITCSLTGLYAKKAERRLKNKFLSIELSITEKSDWCYASITNKVVDIQVKNLETPWTSSYLTITVTEKAPAYTQACVTIQAKSKEIKGFLFTGILAEEQTFEIPFEIGYFSALNIEIDKDRMEITPFEQTNIPIKIVNLGNGPTEVQIDVQNIPDDWTVEYPDSFILDSSIEGNDYEQEIDINVIPSNSFSHQTLKILITGSYLGKPNSKSKPAIINIGLENGDSRISNLFDYNLPIFLVTIFIIISIIIFIKNKYKSK